MTLFRKYYKEANNEIVADEVLISSVLANAHKPPVRRKQYLKYAASLAAAVFVVSAAVISMPVWQRVEEDKDVIIEEFVENTPSPTVIQSDISEENTFPVTSPHTAAAVIPPESDYESSNKTEEKEEQTEQTEQNDDSSSNIPKAELSTPQAKKENVIAEDTAKPDTVPTATAVPVIIQSAETVDREDLSGSDSSVDGPIAGGSSGSSAGSISSSSAGSSSSSSSSSGGGGAASGAFYDAPSAVNVHIPTPPGFYSAGSGSGYAYFASDSDASITVNYSSSNYSSSPSYSESGDVITASFATGSVAYSIYAVGADMSDVEYIVNSLY